MWELAIATRLPPSVFEDASEEDIVTVVDILETRAEGLDDGTD